MPLLNNTKGACSLGYGEDRMQEKIKDWLLDYKFIGSVDENYHRHYTTPKVYREVHVPEIGRRSDLIVYFSNRKVFNIECKLFDANEVIKQAKDHLFWADYSYVCFPHDVYIPNYRRKQMLDAGIGLLFWAPNLGLIEGIMAEHNTGGVKDKIIRQNVLKTLKKIDRENSQQQINFQ